MKKISNIFRLASRLKPLSFRADFFPRLWLLCLPAILLIFNTACAQTNFSIYSDELDNGFQNYSWGSNNFNSTSPVHSGTYAIDFTGTNWQAISFWHQNFNPAPYTNLVFWANGGATGGQVLWVYANYGTNQGSIYQLPPLPANTWQQFNLTFGTLGVAGVTNLNRLTFQLTSDGTANSFSMDDVSLAGNAPVQINVDANQAIRSADARWFGLNTAVYDSYCDTSSTSNALWQLGTKILRFPGGSTADQYNWATDKSGNNTFTWATSFGNFMHVTTNAGAQAMITVNYGTGTPQEAAAWVLCANITNNCHFTNWEVGNECYGTWETDTNVNPHDPYTYAVRAAQYITQMKAADPTISIGVPVVTGEDNNANGYSSHPAYNSRTGTTHYGWTPVVLSTLKSLGVTPDFLILHVYPEYLNDNDQTLLQASSKWPGYAADLRQQISDYVGGTNGTNIQLVCTEDNGDSSIPGKQSTSIVNGLYLADSLAEMMTTEFNSFIWWDLRNGAGTNGDFDSSLYGWRTNGDYGIIGGSSSPNYPTFYGFKLMQYFVQSGDTVLSAPSNYSLLSSYAARKADGTLTLLVINKSSNTTQTAQISITNFIPFQTALVRSFGIAQDEATRTNSTVPGAQDIATNYLAGISNGFTTTFPPYTMTLFTFSPVFTKADTTTMNMTADWVGGFPGTNSICFFDDTISAAHEANLSLGGNLSIGQLVFSSNLNGPVTVSSGGTALTLNGVGTTNLDLSAANQDVTFNCTITNGAAAQAWNVAPGRSLTIGGAIVNGPAISSVSLSGGGTLNLNAADTYNNGTAIYAGIIVMNNASALTAGVVNPFGINPGDSTVKWGAGNTVDLSGRLRVCNGCTTTVDTGGNNVTFSKALPTRSGVTGGLAKYGNGDLALTGTNTYTGNTTITGGRMIVANGSILSSVSTIYVSDPAQLYVTNAVTLTNNLLISGLGYAENDGNRDGAIRMTGSPALGASQLIGNLTLAGNARIGCYNSTAGYAYNTIGGQITGSYGLDLFGLNGNNGAATCFILGNSGNNYAGNTTIYSSDYTAPRTGCATYLTLGANEVIPNGVGMGNLLFTGADANHLTIFNLNGFSETVNGFSVTAAAGARIQNLASGSSVLTVGDGDTTSSFSGSIIDGGTGASLALTKIGLGTLTLSGVNTYTGSTTISSGTLIGIVGGSVANSSVTVNSETGNTLDVQIADNTKSWTNAGLTFAAGTTTLVFDFGTNNMSPSPSVAPMTIKGAVNFTGTPAVVIRGSNLPAGTYPLMAWASKSGTAPSTASLPANVTGGNPALTVSGNALYLNIAVGNQLPATGTNITFNVTGNQMTLNWPASYVGWLLQSNIVSLSNSNYWFTVPGSATTNRQIINFDTTKTNVFFRMAHP